MVLQCKHVIVLDLVVLSKFLGKGKIYAFVSRATTSSSQSIGSKVAQFKEYKDQYGRFSVQIPRDWNMGFQDIKETYDSTSFNSNNIDKMSISISAFNGHKLSDDEFEKITRENNPDTITQTAGAMLVQDTECAKYVIDGQKTCTMIYTEPSADGQYTEKILYVTFDTEKQDFIVSFTGPTDKFDNSLPIFEAMLNSIKAP